MTSKTISTASPDPALFTAKDWEVLFLDHGLLKCMRIQNENIDAKWSTHSVINLVDGFKQESLGKFKGFDWNIPNVSGVYQTLSTYSKVVNSYYTSGYDTESASVGVPLIASGTVTHSSSHSEKTSSSDTEFYATSFFRVPKLRITLNESCIQLTDEFVNAMEDSLKPQKKDDQLYALATALTKYGQYVVTDVELGGLLFETQSTTVSASFDEKAFSESVEASFHADLSAIDVPVSGGGSFGTGSATDKSTSRTQAEAKQYIQVIGGNPAYIGHYPDWANSLNPKLEWHIINTSKLVPVINYLPDDLLIKLAPVFVYGNFTAYAEKAVNLANKGLGGSGLG